MPGCAVAAGLAVTGAVGWCLAGRERGLPLIVTVVVTAQTLLHSAFSLAQSTSGDTAAMNMGMGSMDISSAYTMQMDSIGAGHMAYATGGGTSTVDASTPRLPAKRWRRHDLRHTYALQLLSYLERLMDGEEPDHAARRRRHDRDLSGHIRHNPLLIVSRILGHASPEATYAYLEYTDDLQRQLEAGAPGVVRRTRGGASRRCRRQSTRPAAMAS